VLLVPEDCAEGSCDHGVYEDDHGDKDEVWTCPYPDATVGCAACSVQAGSWAGEWEGQYAEECTVAAPCDVLRALARHCHVPLGR